MSNYDYNDPLRRDPPYDPVASDMNATWGWIAAAVFIVVILAVAFGIGHQGQSGTNTAQNEFGPPAATRMAPPPATMSPIAPTPNTPAQRSTQ
jgi:hypothetical protein